MRSLIKRYINHFKDNKPLTALSEKVEISETKYNDELVSFVIKNDETTSMEFIVKVLESYFGFTRNNAIEIMIKAHTEGKVAIKWLQPEYAKMVKEKVEDEAKKRGYPLRVDIVNV